MEFVKSKLHFFASGFEVALWRLLIGVRFYRYRLLLSKSGLLGYDLKRHGKFHHSTFITLVPVR
jgi:hypothetical protein